jgi:hypothetical protein
MKALHSPSLLVETVESDWLLRNRYRLLVIALLSLIVQEMHPQVSYQSGWM